MSFQVGDILSVALFAHTRHFFVYLGNGEIIEWGPQDGRSWMGGKGAVSRQKLSQDGSVSTYVGRNGERQAITLEQRTGVNSTIIDERVRQMTVGIDYDLGDRNCEHFAYYITGHMGRSGQSSGHFFTDHAPFTSQPMIHTFQQLRDELLKCTFCGYVQPSKGDFGKAVLVHALEDGYYTYHFSHSLGGQHLYVTSVIKSEDFDSSYQSIVLAYRGAFLGRGEILGIVRQLRGC